MCKACVLNHPPPIPAPQAWGQCNANWMGTWCRTTCGKCTPVPAPAPAAARSGSGSCVDQQPTDGTTCAQKSLWGQCPTSWMAQSGW